jgi:TPP-dependent pyruvate/acetoin dehydrogenase alpha subunit
LDERFRGAVSIAENTPKPRLETMFDDVYERSTWNLDEQRTELLSLTRSSE